jgi:hypothetical protein
LASGFGRRKSLANRPVVDPGFVGYPDRDTFDQTYAQLAEWLDALTYALGVPWSATVLGGFSMGAVMSYALA